MYNMPPITEIQFELTMNFPSVSFCCLAQKASTCISSKCNFITNWKGLENNITKLSTVPSYFERTGDMIFVVAEINRLLITKYGDLMNKSSILVSCRLGNAMNSFTGARLTKLTQKIHWCGTNNARRVIFQIPLYKKTKAINHQAITLHMKWAEDIWKPH